MKDYYNNGNSAPNPKVIYLPHHQRAILSNYKECLNLKTQLSCSVKSTKMQISTDSPYCMINNPNYNPSNPNGQSMLIQISCLFYILWFYRSLL